jgi:hypothetical protein
MAEATARKEPSAENPQRIDLPCAWYARDLAEDKSWIWHLKKEHLEELDAALRLSKEKGLAEQEVTKADFPLDGFATVLDQLLDELEFGRGLVMMRGFPVEKYSMEDTRRIYWGMGTHMGITMSQNIKGEHMQEVCDLGFDYTKSEHRGSMTKAKLRPHCDISDVVGLLCVRPAKSGGKSTVSSSMTIYNEIFDHHPEMLPAAHHGYRFDLDGKGPTGHPKEVTNPLPVYSWFKGQLSCRYNQKAIEEGATKIGEPLTKLQQDTIRFIGETAIRPDVEYAMDFRPGDIQWLNNYVTLHARTEFEDFAEPDRKRLLLRLWVNHYKGRPLDDDFANKTLMGPRIGVKKRAATYVMDAAD